MADEGKRAAINATLPIVFEAIDASIACVSVALI